MPRKMIERHRRGPLGWMLRLMFWGFNLLMLYVVVMSTGDSAKRASEISDAQMRSAYETGGAVGLMMLLMIWGIGALVLGALSYMARGRKEIIEVES